MFKKIISKNLDLIVISGVICIIFILIFASVILIFPGISITAAVAVMIVSLFLMVCILMVTSKIKNHITYLSILEDNIKDVGSIRYDIKKREAYLNGDIALLTGLDISSGILDEKAYRDVLAEIMSCRFDMEDDIFMSNCPNKWIKVNTFSFGSNEFTVIRDVSDYVKSMNLIKSLRYYDSATGILNKDAFTHKLRQATENNNGKIGLIHFVITGLEKVASFSGTASTDNVIIVISSFIKKYENPHNTFTGRTTSNEFTIAMTDTYEDGCRKTADKIYAGIIQIIAGFSENEKSHIRVYCGYAVFDRDENSAGSMMASVDFAAFDAERQKSVKPVGYDPASYATSAHEFKKIQVFNELISKNMIDYHFQPIVDAHTGEIYGYESLMRPQIIDGIKLNPLEMLSIAKNQDMLGEIERLTFFNSLKILSENQDFFRERKMFINSISNSFLTDVEYETLYNNFGGLFNKLVVEITESAKISDNAIMLLEKRYKNCNAQIALDDYGTGYANESTLLSVKPDYIKIDRSIMSGIDTDPKKQHLVSNMIDFANQNGIKSLAEGIETIGELETVISLGIDMIQGYVACKAMSILMLEIPIDVRNTIINYNLSHQHSKNKAFEVVDDTPVDIVNLALLGYTDIVIMNSRVNLTGDKDKPVNMRISCSDNSETTVNFENVNIIGLEAPVFTIGENSNVMAVFVGDNIFSNDGIRVPLGSRFVLSGEGNLTINCNHTYSIGIGGDYKQDFGQLLINGTGLLSFKCKGDKCIGIGGGIGKPDSIIKLISGKIKMDIKGVEVLGVGALSGDVNIHINDIEIEGSFSGQYVVGIGSLSGNINIDSNACINMVGSGDKCCMIGTLDNGSGNILFSSGNCTLDVRSKKWNGIGSINGNVNITLNSGIFNIKGEGSIANCIGDPEGSGSIKIENVIINAVTESGSETNIGIKNGKTIISSGNIYTNGISAFNAYSPFGSRLTRYIVKDKNSFKISVGGGNEIYQYSSESSELFTGNYVYLPEGFENDAVENS